MDIVKKIDKNLSLKDFCTQLGISTATGHNWIRLGKIQPARVDNGKPFFSEEQVQQLKSRLESGELEALKSRRNKKYVSGNFLYKNYVTDKCKNVSSIEKVIKLLDDYIQDMRESEIPCGKSNDFFPINLIIADCAVKLLASKKSSISENNINSEESILSEFIEGNISFGDRDGLVYDILGDKEIAKKLLSQNPFLNNIHYVYEKKEDVIGLLYISCTSIRLRKAQGAYYTPTAVVKKLMDNLFEGKAASGNMNTDGKIPVSNRIMTSAEIISSTDMPLAADILPSADIPLSADILSSTDIPLSADIASPADMPARPVIDPCCGTGNFLLQLPDEYDFALVFGQDIDEMSVKIARLNMALKYDRASAETIRSHIVCRNYLSGPVSYAQKADDIPRKYDIIIGNPPWGFSFSEEESSFLRKKFYSAEGKNIESYDIFVEKALHDLNDNGILAFVLPEAILNVKSHKRIRKMIINENSIRYINYLGNTFGNVQCPCIICVIEHTGQHMNCTGLRIETGKRQFTISSNREADLDNLCFDLTDTEYGILDKISNKKNACNLKGNAVFALGIVTGNNSRFITNKPSEDAEPILKGTDILRYRVKREGRQSLLSCNEDFSAQCNADTKYEQGLFINDHKEAPKTEAESEENYIVFRPDSFQQVAATEYYRAPEKLIYRFICSKPVFAYDDRQMLTLNSCNILIPRLDGLDIKYIMTILNSTIVTFFLEKKFHSVKLLRSHIEQIPIAYASQETQKELEELADRLINPGRPDNTGRMNSKCALNNADRHNSTDVLNNADRHKSTAGLNNADRHNSTAALNNADRVNDPGRHIDENGSEYVNELYMTIDQIVRRLYDLDDKEYEYILESTGGISYLHDMDVKSRN